MLPWTDTTLAIGYLLELTGKSQESGETSWLLAGRDHGHKTAPAFRAHLMWQTVCVPYLSLHTPTRQVVIVLVREGTEASEKAQLCM